MNPSVLWLPNCPMELEAWLHVEEQVIEAQYNLAKAARDSDPARSTQLLLLTEQQAAVVLEVRLQLEWMQNSNY